MKYLILKSMGYIVLLLFSFSAHAEKVGLHIDYGIWATKFTGHVIDNQIKENNINLADDLKLSNSLQTSYIITIEPQLAYLPNFRFGRNLISTTGNNKLTKSLIFENTSFEEGEIVDSNLNLDHIEATVYWKVLNNKNRLDLGLTLKDFSGGFNLTGSESGQSSATLDEIIPLFYIGYESDLPLTSFTIGMNSSFLYIPDASFTDVKLFIRYETDNFSGLDLGYRNFELIVDSDVISTKIEIYGLYLSGFLSF